MRELLKIWRLCVQGNEIHDELHAYLTLQEEFIVIVLLVRFPNVNFLLADNN